jgi:hypothetical protein
MKDQRSLIRESANLKPAIETRHCGDAEALFAIEDKKMTLRREAAAALMVAAIILLAPVLNAFARGAIGYDHDACVLKIGPDFMYFTGYQPAISKKKFCEDAPSVGETVFILDYAQSEMREMKTDFRIIRDVPQAEDAASLEAVTEAYLPPKVYPNGTLNFDHTFKTAGNYVGIVTVEGAHGEQWVSKFPFSVGKPYASQTPYYLLAAAAALALLLLVLSQRQEATTSPRKR